MRFAAFSAGLSVLLFASVVGGLHSFNHFGKVSGVSSGRCAPVSGIAGPEDIQIDRQAERAFISSLDRRAPQARGAIHAFDLKDPLNASGWRDRTNGRPEAFRPLGIDYYDDGATRRLFAVNEANAAVEVFAVLENGDLAHLETFAERRMTSPNNVVAVGPRSFYVTNDVNPGRGTMLADLYFLLRSGAGQVLFTDGTIWRVAADGLRFANGVDVDAAGERLYVAETAGNAVRTYGRNRETGALALLNVIKLKAAPDNITVDDAGDVWVGALPKPLAVPRLGTDPEAVAPSEVLRIDARGEAKTVYRNDGEELSASTVAARTGQTLLIGALYDKKFLICNLPDDAV